MPSLDAMKRMIVQDWRAHAKWRAEARENFAFVAGDQWTEEEKQLLSDQARVPIVFNRTATIINSVVGSEINGRTEVKYFPRSMGDAEVNEILTRGAEWYRDQSGAEEEETQGFHDTLVTGLGWVESRLDFETDSEGEPQMERINPLEMCWDASAQRRGLSDAHRFARVREIPWAEAKDMFPDADDADLSARWMDKEKEPDEDEPTRQWSDDDYAHDDEEVEDERRQMATIVQLQYRQRRTEVEYRDPSTGQIGRMGKREWSRLMDQARQMGFEPQMQSRDVRTWEWRQAIIGNEILLENQPCRDCSTFVPITGYWDNAKRQWFGLLRQMKDPQKYANKWLSQTMHILNSNAKGGIMYEEDATDDPDELETQWAAADSAIRLRRGALGQGKVQPKPTVQVPPALQALTEYAVTSIRDVSGVNQELLGLRDQNQPGILEYQRKQSAMSTLAVMFDALRQYRKQQGKIMLWYMREHLADGRLIRIADDEGERYTPLQLDPAIEKYDVIVDDAPSSPNQREKTWEIVRDMVPALMQAGLPGTLWGEIIEYSPLPSSLSQKLKEHMAQMDRQQADPMAQQMQQLAIRQAVAEYEKTMAEAEERKAEAAKDTASAQMEPYRTMYEAQKDAAQAQHAWAQVEGADRKAQMDMIARIAQIGQQERASMRQARSKGGDNG